MKLDLKLEGGQGVIDALRAVNPQANVDAARKSFRQMAFYAYRRVKERTPGYNLKNAWTIESKEGTAWAKWRIYNAMTPYGVTYESTDGTLKAKLKTYPSSEQQTWGDVISILDAGGRPHEITPKRVSMLSWWGTRPGRNQLTGRFQKTRVAVFSKHVSHPGHKAYGMITETVKELDKLFEATFTDRQRSILSAWKVMVSTNESKPRTGAPISGVTL